MNVSGILLDDITQLPLAYVKIYTAFPAETLSGASGIFTIRHPAIANILLGMDFNGETTVYQTRIADVSDVDLGNILVALRPS